MLHAWTKANVMLEMQFYVGTILKRLYQFFMFIELWNFGGCTYVVISVKVLILSSCCIMSKLNSLIYYMKFIIILNANWWLD